jgi:cytochrome c
MNPANTLSRLAIVALVVGSGCAAVAEEGGTLNGAQLYQTKACLSCHGVDGRTPIMPIYPKVAGQQADYLYNQLRDIKSGARNSGQAAIMMGIMAGVADEEMRAIADWLSTQ